MDQAVFGTVSKQKNMEDILLFMNSEICETHRYVVSMNEGTISRLSFHPRMLRVDWGGGMKENQHLLCCSYSYCTCWTCCRTNTQPLHLLASISVSVANQAHSVLTPYTLTGHFISYTWTI